MVALHLQTLLQPTVIITNLVKLHCIDKQENRGFCNAPSKKVIIFFFPEERSFIAVNVPVCSTQYSKNTGVAMMDVYENKQILSIILSNKSRINGDI